MGFQKIVLRNKIMNKMQITRKIGKIGKKNQENSAHRFGENYLTSHFRKFLQDRIKP